MPSGQGNTEILRVLNLKVQHPTRRLVAKGLSVLVATLAEYLAVAQRVRPISVDVMCLPTEFCFQTSAFPSELLVTATRMAT